MSTTLSHSVDCRTLQAASPCTPLHAGFSSGSWSDTEEEGELPGTDDEQSGLDSSTPRVAAR